MVSRRPPRLAHLKASTLDPQLEWTRRKLQVLLAVAVLVVLALVAGGVWQIATIATTDAAATDGTSTPGSIGLGAGGSGGASGGTAQDREQDREQDRLAERPFPSGSVEQAQPGPLSTGRAGSVPIPAPDAVGPVNVPTGFPHTPAGALAQLAAIDQAALGPGSVRTAQAVIQAWAAPGGPTSATWSGVEAVAALLSAAGLPADGAAAGLAVSVEPAMGFIKGTVGADFVIPCIDLVITATIPAAAGGGTQRIAAADCQRMVWNHGSENRDRWVIGAGAEPAPAPSLWPGTQASFDAGYQWLEVTQ